MLGWGLLACIALAYWLALRWQKKQKLLEPVEVTSLAWTERDQSAWKIVQEHAERTRTESMEQLVSVQTYQDTALSLAKALAVYYHPKSRDPFSALTIPEILTVVELATRDLSRMVDQYLPGGHLLRIKDFQNLKQLAGWYPTIRDVTWLLSALFTPLQTAARYLTANVGLSGPWQRVQQNILVWFFNAYVQRVGFYLIELNSGRLRVGAERYLELKEQFDLTQQPGQLQIVLIGQTNVGKSSLINAFLGEQKALTDVLPSTPESQCYRLKPTDVETELDLIDTAGYGTQGPMELQEKATEKLMQTADLILLVLHARSPGRQADIDQMKKLDAYFEKHPDIRRPPIIGVLTHIDLLSPMMEWSPPYQWSKPETPKEKNIYDAVMVANQQMGGMVSLVVPVCAAPGKEYGISENLLPVMSALFNQAQAVALLRVLNVERNQGKVKRVFEQLFALGKGIMQVLSEKGGEAKSPSTASMGLKK